MSRATVFVLVGTLVASIAAGALVTSAASGDGGDTGEATSGPTIPVLGPDSLGAASPLEDPARTEDGVGGDGSGGGSDSPIVGAATGVDPDALPAPDEVVEPVPTDDLGRTSTDRGTASDPCAGREAGSGPEEGCDGTDGVGGTVLAALDAFPLNIRFVRISREPDCVERFGNVDAGEYPVSIISNIPGVFMVARGPLGGALGEPVRVETSRTERRRVAEETSELAFAASETCLLLTGIEPGTTALQMQVDGTSDAGFTDSWHGVLEIPELRQRPPVQIVPVDRHRLRVDVPVKEGERVEIRGGVHGESGGCAVLERDGSPLPHTVDYVSDPVTPREPIPESVRRADGYAYDGRYTEVLHRHVLLSERASVFDLCILWFGRGRSFDSSRVTEREAHVVSRPASYVVEMQIAGVEGDTSFDPSTLGVMLYNRPSGGSYCQYLNEASVEPGLGAPLKECGSVGTDTLDLGVRVSHRVGDDWRSRDVGVSVRRSPCRGSGAERTCQESVTEWYRVAIPGSRRGLCGSGWGECPRGDSPGTVVLRLDYEAPDGPLVDDWDLANQGAFAPAETVTAIPPPYPQMDFFRASVTPVDPGPTVLAKGITIAFPVVDRPLASSRAFVDPEDGVCLVDPAAATVSNIGDRRSLQLGGLCPGTTYQVVLQLTDLEGNTATYTSLPSAYAAPSFAWRDASATTEKYAASISYRMHATASEELPKEAESQRMGLEWWGIFLDDQPVERLRDRAGTWCHAFDEDFGFGYHARDEVWPGNIPFGAHLVVWPGRCDSGLRYRHNVEVSFSEQVSLQRLLAGETVTFTKTVPFSETGVITVTVEFFIEG